MADWGRIAATAGGLALGGPLGGYAAYKYEPGAVAGVKKAYGGAKDIFGGIGDAIDHPYEEQRQGLENIQQRLMQLKGERLGRKDQEYNQANAQYDDTRKAMKYAFGDPSNWRL